MKTSDANYQSGHDDVEGARLYRIAQAAEIRLRFQEAEGRKPKDVGDLMAWVARSGHERPIRPRAGL